MLKNLLLLLLPVSLFAQVSVTGKIINQRDKQPVPDASVFLSNASVGSKSGDDGSFTLNNVRNGQYDLVISCIGFETYHQAILVNNSNLTLPNIEMTPAVVALKEVKIRPNFDREKYLKLFKAEFFGHTENARDCKLLNPDALDLDYHKITNIVTASSSEFLLIENPALGYRIKYLLQTFEYDRRGGRIFYAGASVFEPMKGSSTQEKRWQKKRIAAYRGSQMHFLRACVANDVPDEGFMVYQLIRKPNPDRPTDSLISAKLSFFNALGSFNAGFTDSSNYWRAKSNLPKLTEILNKATLNTNNYLRLTQTRGIFGFGYADCLLIKYNNLATESVVTFHNSYSFFDNNGIILNPDSNTLEGFWGTQRMADLLPVDYELPATVN